QVVPLRTLHRKDYSLPYDQVLNSQNDFEKVLKSHPYWLTLQFSPLCDSIIVRSAEVVDSGVITPDSNASSIWERTVNTAHSKWAKNFMRVIQPVLKLTSSYNSTSMTSTLMPYVCHVMSL